MSRSEEEYSTGNFSESDSRENDQEEEEEENEDANGSPSNPPAPRLDPEVIKVLEKNSNYRCLVPRVILSPPKMEKELDYIENRAGAVSPVDDLEQDPNFEAQLPRNEIGSLSANWKRPFLLHVS